MSDIRLPIIDNMVPPKDERYVWGITCTWHGPIYEVGKLVGGQEAGSSIPCCPYCGGPLFEANSKAEWDKSAQKFCEECMEGDPDYILWLESLHRPFCRSLNGWDWKGDFEKFKREKFEART